MTDNQVTDINKIIKNCIYNMIDVCSLCVLPCERVIDKGKCPEIIKYLKSQNKALEQQTCDDVVSRQTVLEIIEKEPFKGDAISEIEKLPSVTPKEKTGMIESQESEVK